MTTSEALRLAARRGWLLLPDIRVPGTVRVEGTEGRVLRFDRSAPAEELVPAIMAVLSATEKSAP